MYSKIDKVIFECDINVYSPNSKISFSAMIDGVDIYDVNSINVDKHLSFIIDNKGSHKIQFTLTNKEDNDTILDKHGNILDSAIVRLNNIKLNDIIIDRYLVDISSYTHDYNGYGCETNEAFVDIMAYNGVIDINLEFPLYNFLVNLL